MHIYQSPGDVQTDSQSTVRVRLWLVYSSKHIEDFIQHVGRNSNAGVFDSDDDIITLLLDHQLDLAPFLRIIRSIGQQVIQHLDKPGTVAINVEQLRRYLQHEIVTTFVNQRATEVDGILKELRESGSNILETDDLVNTLEQSKIKATETINKLSAAKKFDEKIKKNRENFEPVALQGAKLYFAVQDLSMLDPMYQFSMKWFKDLFNSCFRSGNEEATKEAEEATGSFVQDSTPGSKPKLQVRR